MKIIILPHKKFCRYGKILKFNKLYKKNLCDFLLNNNININNNCGGFGRCVSCSVFINEGFSFFEINYLKLNYTLSCQFYDLNCNIIISIL
ncbi:2Fe-2S iron-sulfur cluster-binding protein [Candidatus Nasuia deltocephalinicola]|uniref:2Fe-2S iron-sulfur cluster-binding protein n=1 Tax=Candidatus Nasuia deltocephalincola TaxID=1160784 RepID=UPI00216B4016|nr:2Fe-2S iron-sulfur cluster-binding protein [Candidatus Nasuia deltocephalinicola]